MAPPEHIDTVSVSDITARLSDIRILKKYGITFTWSLLLYSKNSDTISVNLNVTDFLALENKCYDTAEHHFTA